MYLFASKLDWVITGKTKDTSDCKDETGLLILSHGISAVVSKKTSNMEKEFEFISQPDITDFWNLDSIGIIDQSENPDNEKAMQPFREKLKFQNGRYQVTWPWKQHKSDLPVNRSLALERLKSYIDWTKKTKQSY